MCSDKAGGDDDEAIFDQLDFSGIAFPSDRLSIRDLRRKYPECFDIGLRRGEQPQPLYFPHTTFGKYDNTVPHSEDLGGLLFSERLVAAYAYAAAHGIHEPGGYEGELGLSGFKSDLTRSYVALGIANGEHQAAEMIRDIERQARQLAPDLPP